MAEDPMDDLLEALLLEGPPARQAWERWRASVETDALPYGAQLLLPALNRTLSEWLAQDPAAGIFQGIVRKVWTQNQLRLRKAVEVAAVLKQAAVRRPAIAGPLAWSLRATPPAIRAIPYLTFLVDRADVSKATQALAKAGWNPHGDAPSGEAMDWCEHISFSQENLQLYLHWRLVPVAPEDAFDCERQLRRRLSTVEWNRQTLVTTSAETTLLHILCGGRDSDLVPWQADIALTGTAQIDWTKFWKLASRFGPRASERLQELRDRGWALPEFACHDTGLLKRKFRQCWSEYRTRSYCDKQAVTGLGFLQFLAARWNLRSAWNVPFFAVRRALQERRTLAR